MRFSEKQSRAPWASQTGFNREGEAKRDIFEHIPVCVSERIKHDLGVLGAAESAGHAGERRLGQSRSRSNAGGVGSPFTAGRSRARRGIARCRRGSRLHWRRRLRQRQREQQRRPARELQGPCSFRRHAREIARRIIHTAAKQGASRHTQTNVSGRCIGIHIAERWWKQAARCRLILEPDPRCWVSGPKTSLQF